MFLLFFKHVVILMAGRCRKCLFDLIFARFRAMCCRPTCRCDVIKFVSRRNMIHCGIRVDEKLRNLLYTITLCSDSLFALEQNRTEQNSLF